MKYDALGRIASTGIYTNATPGQTTRQDLQWIVDEIAAQWESRIGVANYSNVAFPSNTSQLSERTVNYYDDYTFNGAATSTLQPLSFVPSGMTRGLSTGTRVTRDDGTAPLLTINYYNDRGELVQSVSQNHLGGTDWVTRTAHCPSTTAIYRSSSGGMVPLQAIHSAIPTTSSTDCSTAPAPARS